MIRVAAIMTRFVTPEKFYFLLGYTEELLSNWLKCPVKLEIQTVPNRESVTYKYV